MSKVKDTIETEKDFRDRELELQEEEYIERCNRGLDI